LSRRVEINTQTIETAIGRMQQHLISLREHYDAMRRDVNQVQDMDYRSESGNVFVQKINEYDANIVAIEEVINDYRVALANFANQVSEEEDRIKNMATNNLMGKRVRRG